jgi:hypothetical protein
MSIIFPEATKVQGNTSVVVVQTIANMAAPDLSSEINAGSSVNVSCFLYGDLNPTVETNKGEAPRRLCTTQVFQQFGNTTYEVPDLQYVYDPQAASSTDDNKALAALTEGSEVYLVIRRGSRRRPPPWRRAVRGRLARPPRPAEPLDDRRR